MTIPIADNNATLANILNSPGQFRSVSRANTTQGGTFNTGRPRPQLDFGISMIATGDAAPWKALCGPALQSKKAGLIPGFPVNLDRVVRPWTAMIEGPPPAPFSIRRNPTP